ncbi:MAG: phosphatidylserine/phosphatidylglycerophosphate/cardiolipin synthase family protein [Planctomycetota bacterium]
MRFLILSILALATVANCLAVDVLFAPSKKLPETIEQELDAANESIDLAIYSFTDTRAQKKLIEAAQRGIAVRVILHNARKQSKLADKIEESGGDVRYVTKIMHHKFAVFDRKRLLTGSANWSRSAYSRYDEDLLIFGESDQDYTDRFIGEFEHIWGNAKEYGETRFKAKEYVVSNADVTFTSANLEVTQYRGQPTFRTAAELPGACGSRLIKAIQAADSEILIASAHFRRFDLHNELLLAMQRGVKVRMVFDQQEFHYAGTKTPNALYDEALQRAGAEVRYKVYSRFWDYRTALQLHLKCMVVDRQEVLTGSLNWSENAELGTFENLVVIDDEETVAKYVERYQMIDSYGKGKLDGLVAGIRKEDGKGPCTFKPITLNGEELAFLRKQYKASACQ